MNCLNCKNCYIEDIWGDCMCKKSHDISTDDDNLPKDDCICDDFEQEES